MPNKDHDSTPAGASRFCTTQWSIVASAGGASTSNARDALESLCHWYWFPLYAYVRRRVRDVDQARDLTQAFFERLLEKNYLADADPARGRFRSFLITAFKHFLSKEWDKARAEKRGGDRQIFSLNFEEGDSRIEALSTSDLTAEQQYERQWAITLLGRVMDRLSQEYTDAGKGPLFEHLKGFLVGQDQAASYASVAEVMESTEAAMKMTAHRMRKRYRELLREEILQTLADPAEIDDEIHRLFTIFQN